MMETFKDSNMDNVQKMRESIDKLRGYINLHELDFRARQKRVTFDNPISFYDLSDEINILTEGLMTTYPIDKTVHYIKDYFKLNENDIQIIDNCICIIIPDVGENINIMKKVLNVCGYYPGTIKVYDIINGVKYKSIQFEPKFQEDVGDDVRQNVRILYHITPFYNEHKILDNGFSPRNRNELFDFPDRVYFMKARPDKEIIDLGLQLNKYNNSKGNDGKYTVFEIDATKIPENIKIYKDLNYKYGYFITDNLSPTCITNVGHINFNSKKIRIYWKK